MKVRLIKKKSIENFVAANGQSRISFRIWLSLIKRADWSTPEDIAGTFGSADLMGKGSNRVVFDIGGNHYRLICSYHFGVKMVHLFVKWIGTHAAYTQLCKSNKQFSINQY
jgi:mRNA interferase HigB